MHAFLFIGGTATERQDAINLQLDTNDIPLYDRLTLTPQEKASIGVADARVFIHELFLNPRGTKGTAAIIPDAGLLTTEAQQALLKTIEEPPPHVQLYIGTASETVVLPTIVSRCQLVPISAKDSLFTESELAACTKLITEIRAASAGHKISSIQTIGKTRDDAKRWIDCAVIACTNAALLATATDGESQEKLYVASLVHELLDAKKLSQNNVNPFQLIEHIFLH